MAPFRTGRAPGHYAMRFARQNAEAQRAKGEASEFSKERRASWAGLLRKIFEVDPLLCPCGAEMKIISVITDSRLVDRILRHLQSPACTTRDPFPAAPAPGDFASPPMTPHATTGDCRARPRYPCAPRSGRDHASARLRQSSRAR